MVLGAYKKYDKASNSRIDSVGQERRPFAH